MRDMTNYVAQFHALPFEPIQASYRRNLVIKEVLRHQPRRILEIGCGMDPLFTQLPAGIHSTVVEPADEFARRAREIGQGRDGISIVQSFVEEFHPDQTDFDVIVASCVLHEVPDPQAMLAAIRRLCRSDTVLHVNVPNANSFHRQLAVAMGLIPFAGAPSDTQRAMQQRTSVYDISSLSSELRDAGFELLASGSIFIKPFTHGQMQRLVDAGLLTADMLNGLDRLAEVLPDLGSEIWVNARRTS